jgi:carboxyl-terminal processing protease
VIKDTVKYTTLNGRTVYGGGGILPDSVINSSYDSTLYAYYQLIRKGLIYNYALDYVEGNRNKLKQKWTAESFIESFGINQVSYDDFIKSIQKSGLKLSDKSLQLSKKKIKYLLKAYIGRDLFGEEVFYPVYLKDDEVYLTAIAE